MTERERLKEPEQLTMMRDAWWRVIYDVTGDVVKTDDVMALADLNGLFDTFKVAAECRVDGEGAREKK